MNLFWFLLPCLCESYIVYIDPLLYQTYDLAVVQESKVVDKFEKNFKKYMNMFSCIGVFYFIFHVIPKLRRPSNIVLNNYKLHLV